MGCNLSKDDQTISMEQSLIVNEALKRFDLRVKSYSYPYHGPYYEYIEWCRAKFQLECISKDCRQGPNYRPQNDYYNYN
jgi:hypothetical protein